MIAKIKRIVKDRVERNYFEKVIARNNHEDFFFVQIGACDGKSFDPIYQFVKKYNWKGILMEPIPHLYEELKKNYSDNQGLTLLNMAIAETNGPILMDTISREGLKHLPKWAKGISSISNTNRNALSVKYWEEGRGKNNDRSSYSELEKYKIQVEVPGITLKHLFDNYASGKNIDLLQIDAEGYDYQILKTLDLKIIRPVIIHFEYASMTQEEKSMTTTMLKNHGYQLDFYGNNDALALRSKK